MNGVSTPNYYVNAVTNNSFTLEDVGQCLKDTMYNSFNYLSDVQKRCVDLFWGKYTAADLEVNFNKTKVTLHVGKDLIDPSVRHKYRVSDFYQKELTLNEIANNQDIFIRIPLVFINGQNTVKYTVRAINDTIEIYFNYSDSLMQIDQLSVIFVLNDGIEETVTNRYVFAQFNNKLPVSIFGDSFSLNSPSLTTITGMSELVGSSFNFATFEDNEISIDLSANASSIINNNRRVTVSLIKTRYMHTLENIITTYVDANNDVQIMPFIITDDDGDAFKMPIPVENIIVSKYNTTIGDFVIDHNISVTRTYPFIYDIVDSNKTSGDMYQVIYFYYPLHEKYQYTNYLDNCHQMAVNFISRDGSLIDAIVAIRNGYAPPYESMLSYTPPSFEYTFDDYEDSEEYPYHFNYKIETLASFISEDPWILQEYVKRQNHLNYGYELDVSNVDLSDRIRYDTYSDVSLDENKQILNESCYLFKFVIGGSINFLINVVIDGLYYNPLIFREYGIDYIYIPCSLVSSTSIIEIERVDTFKYNKSFTFSDLTDVSAINTNIHPDSNVRPIMKDAEIINEENGPIDNSVFSFIKIHDDEEYDISTHPYAPLDQFTIKLNDPGYLNKVLTLTVTKDNTICDYTSDEDPILVSKIPFVFLKKRNNLRTYVNNRLIDSSNVIITGYGQDECVIIIKVPLHFGDNVMLILSPIEYNQVYAQSIIPESGYIDLVDAINKPLSMSYYDIYVNGRKLTNNNFIQLTPAKVMLCGLTSLKNLTIYEKERDPIEYFGELVDFKNGYSDIETWEDKVLSQRISGFDNEKVQYLKDIIAHKSGFDTPLPANSDTETLDIANNVIDDASVDLILMAFKFIWGIDKIDPDERQLVTDDVASIGENVDEWLTSDSEASGEEINVLHLNPDIAAENSLYQQIISSDKEYTQNKLNL